MQLKVLSIIWLAIILCNSLETAANITNTEKNENKQEPAKITNSTNVSVTAAIYARIFKERRKEHQYVVKQMIKSTYEKNFKLLKLAYEKIFEVISEQNATLTTNEYVAKVGFPQTDPMLQDAVVLTLENCCIAAESLLHFPEMSYHIFKKSKFTNWKPILNWCIEFVNEFVHIIDEPTVKLLSLLQQEINEELREPNYANPYYQQKDENEINNRPKSKKSKKKVKRGPQLSGKIEL